MSNKSKLLSIIKSKFKDSKFVGGTLDQDLDVIPTGVDVLDHYILGCGGLPIGRVMELYSQEGAGKTSLGYTFLAAAQHAGGVGILLDTEHAFDPERAELFGVDVDELMLVQPDHLEDVILEITRAVDAVKDASIAPVAIVWDSIAGTPAREELENDFDSSGFDKRAKTISKAMRVVSRGLQDARASLVCINQTRQKIGVIFGDNTTTPGGMAVKFHASIRVQLLGGKAIKDADEHVGKDLTVMTTKSRFSPPFRKCKLRLNYADGWDNQWSTLNLAKDKKFVAPRARGAKAYNEAREKFTEQLQWPEQGPVEDTDVEDGS